MGENLLKKMALAPNWEDLDAARNSIINYFADRHHTEIILKQQGYFIAETCSYCKECKNCTKRKTYREELKKIKVFGHLIKTLDIGMFTIQIGAIEFFFFH